MKPMDDEKPVDAPVPPMKVRRITGWLVLLLVFVAGVVSAKFF